MEPRVLQFRAYDRTLLTGDLYSAGLEKPCVIMSQGFSGLRGHFLPDFATRFQAAGYAVFLYDNRCWGDSEGLPRNQVDPQLQTRDYLDAFNFVCSLPEVDATRIVYWGSSMSAGNVICAAAINEDVRGVIAQVPFVSGEAAMAKTNAPSSLLIGERAQAINKAASTLLPIFPESPEELASGASRAVLQDPRCFAFLDELEKRGCKKEKLVTVQSLTYAGMHEPGAYIHRISPIPLLMVIAENDVVASTSQQLAVYERALEPKQYHLCRSAGHFDPYFGECFEENICVQLKYLEKIFA